MKDEDRFSPTTRGADYLSYGYLGYINSEKGEDRGGTTYKPSFLRHSISAPSVSESLHRRRLTRIMSSDYKLGIMVRNFF